jgi:hypothetical protein
MSKMGRDTPLEPEAYQRALEEYKELGHEYRYRDQLMVQEFQISMIAAGVLLAATGATKSIIVISLVELFGAAYFLTLTHHMSNIHRDRRANLSRKKELGEALGFRASHLNVSGKVRLPAPRNMIWLMWMTSAVWILAFLSSIPKLSAPQLHLP